MTQIHVVPKPSPQAIQGQRQQTANREAALTGTIHDAQQHSDPVTAQATPREPFAEQPQEFTPAWNVSPGL